MPHCDRVKNKSMLYIMQMKKKGKNGKDKRKKHAASPDGTNAATRKLQSSTGENLQSRCCHVALHRDLPLSDLTFSPHPGKESIILLRSTTGTDVGDLRWSDFIPACPLLTLRPPAVFASQHPPCLKKNGC